MTAQGPNCDGPGAAPDAKLLHIVLALNSADPQRRPGRARVQPLQTMMDAELRRYSERPPELQPAIDAAEAFLFSVFLRRYVTYCARRGRYAAMNGAVRLFAEIRASAA